MIVVLLQGLVLLTVGGYTGNGSRLAENLRPSWIGSYPDVGCSEEHEIVCVAKPN